MSARSMERPSVKKLQASSRLVADSTMPTASAERSRTQREELVHLVARDLARHPGAGGVEHLPELGADDLAGAARVLAGGVERVGDRCRLVAVDGEQGEHVGAGDLGGVGHLGAHDAQQRAAGEVLLDPRVLEQQLQVHVEDARGAVAALDVAPDPEQALGDAAQHGRPPCGLVLLLLLLLVVTGGVLRVVVLEVATLPRPRRAPTTAAAWAATRPWMLWSEVSSGSSPTTQVSFEPPPCELLTTSWPSGSATRVSPPGSTQTSVPSLTANGRRSAWRGRMPSSTSVGMVDSCTTGCAIQPRGSARSRRARAPRARLALASGPTTSPLPPGSVDGLHDELVEPVEHLLEGARLLEPPGLHVRQDRLLGEVVADEVGHVGVDELVVGDAVADRVGDRHVAEPRGEQQAGRAEHRVGAELQRIEELVVDAAVDHVDAGRTGGGAHPHPAAGAEQVAALDQLDAHQAGEQRVLEVGRVVDAGGEHDDRRVFDAVRCRCAQRARAAAAGSRRPAARAC